MTASQNIIEVLTGRMRPRHRRFYVAFAGLSKELLLKSRVSTPSLLQRLIINIETRRRGVRTLNLSAMDGFGLLHQALNRGDMPYIAEFDVPMALHGYKISCHRRGYKEARGLLERPQLRTLLTFSSWAQRSFGLHFGPEVEAKCKTIYPLAYEGAYCGELDFRYYDFIFISTQFRIKCGPEVVRAFCEIRHSISSAARFCVVTNLTQAREALGDLSGYPGVDWRESAIGESEIADLLAKSRCLVHPSLSDSFGVVVLEALAAGCAVISSDFASFCEMVTPTNGWLISAPTATVVGDTYITEYGDTDYHHSYLNTLSLHRFERDIASCMANFLLEPARARQMMQASRALYIERFSAQNWKNRMHFILKESFPELGLRSE